MGVHRKVGRLSLDGAAWAALCAHGAACSACAPPEQPAHHALRPATPAGPAAVFLDALPDSVLQLHLLPLLSADDKRALRGASPHARALLNACVSRVRLAAGDLLPDDAPGAAAPVLGRRFPGLRAVEAYDCTDAPVTDELLTGFLADCGPELLAQLREFDIKRCGYIGRGLLQFLRDTCPGLTRLSASRWTDNVTAQAVGRLAGLEELDLGESDGLDDAGLLPLRGLARLRRIGLQRCRWIGDAGCRTLAQITSLGEVSLAGTDTGAAGLAALASLPCLRRLDVSGCRRVTDEALAALAGASGLEVLELRNTEVHSAGLTHLAPLPRLRELDLGSRFELDDGGVASLAAFGALSALTVGSFNLTRPPPPGFGARLERLTFGGGFANKGLDLLFPLPRLRSLHATGIDTVTDRVMRTVSSQTSLEELSLRSGYSLTSDGLMSLQALANLSALSVASCPAISDRVLAEFTRARRAAPLALSRQGSGAAAAAAVAAAPAWIAVA